MAAAAHTMLRLSTVLTPAVSSRVTTVLNRVKLPQRLPHRQLPQRLYLKSDPIAVATINKRSTLVQPSCLTPSGLIQLWLDKSPQALLLRDRRQMVTATGLSQADDVIKSASQLGFGKVNNLAVSQTSDQTSQSSQTGQTSKPDSSPLFKVMLTVLVSVVAAELIELVTTVADATHS